MKIVTKEGLTVCGVKQHGIGIDTCGHATS